MFDIVLIWWGEILSWSLMGVKELDKHSVVEKNLNWQKDVKEKIFAFDCSTFFKIYIALFQPTHAIIIKAWVMPLERAVT